LETITPLESWIAHKINATGALSRESLTAYQLAALRKTLGWVRARSPFYRAHLATAPAELNSLAELAAFPFTTAADLQENPLRFVCVSQSEIARVVTLDSSGTTGLPKRLYFTEDDQELTVDFFQAGMSTFTRPGDRVLILLPSARPGSVGNLLARALERLGAEGIRHGPVKEMRETLEMLAATQATGLVGMPAQILALARYPDPTETSALRFALLTADHVPQAIVSAVEKAWGCTVYNHYGMTEMGLGGGVDCSARRGYHLREADLWVEIVDPASGQPIPEGEEGEIVFTTLTRRGMPLIRYRTGDAGRFAPRACPCGSVLRTMAHVTRRIDGAALGGMLPLALLDEALFALEGVVDFKAVFSPGELFICFFVFKDNPDLTARGRAALLQVPVIAKAVELEELVIRSAVVESDHVPPPVKRRIE